MKEESETKGKRKKRGRLTAFKLHGTGLNIHWEILQVHRAGQGQSQPEIKIEKEKRGNKECQKAQKGLRKGYKTQGKLIKQKEKQISAKFSVLQTLKQESRVQCNKLN